MSPALLAQTVVPDFGRGSSCVRDNGTFCWSWFSDHWGSIFGPAVRQHVVLTLVAVTLGALISFALALFAHRRGRAAPPITFVTGVLYTIPSLALFQFLVPLTGLTFLSAQIALVSYTLLILFRNFLTGLSEVPSEVREAAEGMGFTRRQVLWRVELPLALPAIFAGLRIATVTVISLATVAALVGINQGLGVPITDGIQRQAFNTELLAAGVLTVALAILADLGLVLVQRGLTPWTRRSRA